MADRDQYLLRCLVTAQRERKMAMKTRDPGVIKAAETRLAVVWKDATDHVDASTRAAILAGTAGVRVVNGQGICTSGTDAPSAAPAATVQPPKAGGWIAVRDESPPTDEPVVYRRPNDRRPGVWNVGIAYWTVSQKWDPEAESQHAPAGFTHWKPL